MLSKRGKFKVERASKGKIAHTPVTSNHAIHTSRISEIRAKGYRLRRAELSDGGKVYQRWSADPVRCHWYQSITLAIAGSHPGDLVEAC